MHAQHLETSPVAELARLNCYYMKASQPGWRASPVGVKQAGPESGLARFNNTVRFRDVYVTWWASPFTEPARIPGQLASM